jgi:ABC-type multidrug transport system ATPase subunit
MKNVEIEKVFFSYNSEKSVLNGINLNIGKNEIVGLLGSNGSGKTTTLKLLAGLLSPSGGEIKIFGNSFNHNRKEIKKLVAFVPEETLLYSNLSAFENMNLFSMLWGTEMGFAKNQTEKLLKEVGLWEVRNEWISSYSKGMKQKLSLCAALVNEPQILIMDEPFNGFDVDSVIWAREMFKAYILKENRSIIFTSHVPEIIESFATRIVILKEGKIIQDASLDQSVSSALIEV